MGNKPSGHQLFENMFYTINSVCNCRLLSEEKKNQYQSFKKSLESTILNKTNEDKIKLFNESYKDYHKELIKYRDELENLELEFERIKTDTNKFSNISDTINKFIISNQMKEIFNVDSELYFNNEIRDQTRINSVITMIKKYLYAYYKQRYQVDLNNIDIKMYMTLKAVDKKNKHAEGILYIEMSKK